MTPTLSGDDLVPVAGNGILHRRLFLKNSLVLAVAGAGSAATAAEPEVAPSAIDPASPPWMHKPGLPFTGYGKPSKFEARTLRNIGGNRDLAGNGVSWTPLEALEGIITPSGLHFERHHNGVPEIDPAHHKLVIHGAVRQALSFTVENLLRYPMRSHIIFLECGGNSNAGWHSEPIQRPVGSFHGLVSCSEWTGVPLSVLLDQAGVDAKASWVIAEGADALVDVNESGRVEGDIRAPNVVISGEMVGDVVATEKLVLGTTARVKGNIFYKLLEMNAGAQVNGQMVHQDEPQRALPKPEEQ